MSDTTSKMLTIAALGLLSACAATGPASESTERTTYNDCFFASSLRDWRPLDDRNLILFANGRRPYHVELVRPAFGLSYDFMIGVYDRDGRICPFGGDAVIVDGPMPERITIRSIRELTDAELEAVLVEFGIEPPPVVDEAEVALPDEGEAQDPQE